MCVVAALLTAIYMTRLMLYTFHGPNRTGEREGKALREAPWVMTGPLVVLGVLSAVGGFLNTPTWLPIGPSEGLARWLDPVTGAASRTLAGAAESDPSLAPKLAAVAAVIAVAGIVFAVVRLKPAALKPAREPQPVNSPVADLLEHKYYVDEVYDQVVVDPLVGASRTILWRGADGVLIDGLVNLAAKVWQWIAAAGSALQNGEVGTYAWALVLGVVVVLSAVAFRS